MYIEYLRGITRGGGVNEMLVQAIISGRGERDKEGASSHCTAKKEKGERENDNSNDNKGNTNDNDDNDNYNNNK